MYKAIKFIPTLTICTILSASAYADVGESKHNPRDIKFWSDSGSGKDWSEAAAKGDAQAEFHQGMELLRPHLLIINDRVPVLSYIPLVGKMLFQSNSYCIDDRMEKKQMTKAYRWIKQSANQGFPPAKEAEKLFAGKVK